MLAAGLLAKKAVERGLRTKPWVKTSLAPGSQVVTDYLDEAGLTPYLEQLGFYLVGYGCTTCIGNCGPLPEPISRRDPRGQSRRRVGALRQPQLRGPRPAGGAGELPRVAAARRRLRARRHDGHRPAQRAARRRATTAQPVYLRDIWPTQQQVTRRDAHVGEVGDVPREVRARLRGRRTTGARSTSRRASCSRGTRSRPTSSSRRTSTACTLRARRRPPTCAARACWRCSATPSRPTTSRRPARSRRRRPPAST